MSEEKQAELPDQGVQCPGPHRFEYAICVHEGDWHSAGLLGEAARYHTPVRAVTCGRGKGQLPRELSLFSLDNRHVHVTCVKQAEDGTGIIVRLFNPLNKPQKVTFTFACKVERVAVCRADESEIRKLKTTGKQVAETVGPKKIVTYLVTLRD